jgi:hypothetical protein
MKRFHSFLKVNPIMMAALAASLTPGAFAADTHCSSQNLIMKGTYVLSGSGSIVGVGPLTAVGLFTYNGDGTGVSGTTTISINGMSSTSSGAPATYTVNPDCSGSKTIGSGPSAQHYNFVITPDGKTITFIDIDPTVALVGNAVRLGN